MEPLNPLLYRRLQRMFGRVQVANQGEEMDARAGFDMFTEEPRLNIRHAGEYYRVNCPYCSDTTQRLWINYKYGKTDGHGRVMTYLTICYNEACTSEPKNAADLYENLSGLDDDLEEAVLKPGKKVPVEAQVVTWPGLVVRLDKLPHDHKARRYLESRRFDPDKMARLYDVHYCRDSIWYLARDRLVLPVYKGGTMRGWQCRYVGELPWKDKEKKHGLPPKYFSTPGGHFRSRTLYNFDRARNWETGVIVEGPTDVWSFGPMSMCVFGNTMTEIQQQMFLTAFSHHTGVLLLDPEEFNKKSTQALAARMKLRMPNRFAVVKLPDKTDPGSLDRDFLWDYVKSEAAEQGVKVRFRKRR